jgi:phage terminase large subunit
MFSVTTAVKKIRAVKARKKIIQGGSSAGKTIAILIILIDKCIKEPGLEVSVISESIPHLKKGAMKDFLKIMDQTGRFNRSNWNATDRKYTFSNGSYMEFFSPESVLGSRRNILYINEANNIHYADYHQLAIRTSADIYIDFNPAAEFWAHTEVAIEDNAELISITYLDNGARPSNVDEEFAIARQKAAREAAQGLPITSYWQNWVRVYVDGLTGNLQGVVFNNWEQIDDVPIIAELVAHGQDYGFTNDPSATVAVYQIGMNLYLDELLYETGLLTSEIVARYPSIGITYYQRIIPDSAEPKSNEEVRRAGYNVDPARKGPDSVRASINKLQEYKIFVTKRSTNLIKELRAYRWKVDQSGKALQEPVDYMNHAIDAVRYVALNCLSRSVEVRAY